MSSDPLPTVTNGAPPPPPERPDPAAARLLGTLGVAGALAGLLLVVVNGWTEPRIQAHRAAELDDAIRLVLGGPDRYERLFVVDDALVPSLPAGEDSTAFDAVYLGYDASGRAVGFAIPGGKPGFQDVIRLIFGFDAQDGRVLGMKVLESKETPGLGDKIEKDSSFVGAFVGALAPLVGLKAGAGTGDPHEIDMITGATISSRTVIAIINERLEALDPSLRAHAAGVADRTDPSPGDAHPSRAARSSSGGGDR